MMRFFVWSLTLLLGVVAGCSGTGFPVSTVEGQISVDGKPVPSGTVSFMPLESHAGQAISADIKDGRYRSEQVPRGKLLIMISSFIDVGEKHVEFGIEYPKLKNMIPDKYRSGVELTVDAPKMMHNFEFTSQ